MKREHTPKASCSYKASAPEAIGGESKEDREKSFSRRALLFWSLPAAAMAIGALSPSKATAEEHEDTHTDWHSDTPYNDGHEDISNHGDSQHADGHEDWYSDSGETIPHSDEYFDAHTDVHDDYYTHEDTHVDEQHADEHGDDHLDFSYVDHTDHGDTPYEDYMDTYEDHHDHDDGVYDDYSDGAQHFDSHTDWENPHLDHWDFIS